jgi:4-hydroxy-tetrahydrodipicolinate synthase
MLRGTFTALVTPFKDDEIDEPAFERLIENQIAAGINGIVPVGTTGESPTLSCGERHHVIELAVETARDRCQVIAGTGSNSTRDAIAHTKEAETIGADGALLVAPYYNKPSQEGLFRHFAAIAEATSLQLVLYNIPGRCGVDIAADTVVRLAEKYPKIVAIKEASGSVDRAGHNFAGRENNRTRHDAGAAGERFVFHSPLVGADGDVVRTPLFAEIGVGAAGREHGMMPKGRA